VRALAAIVVLAGCSPSDVAPGSIDPSLVTVFFPVELERVYGRGFAGATDAPYVYAAAHPSVSSEVPKVEDDGSFSFDLHAESGDLIELAPSPDIKAIARGAPLFIRVPEPEHETKERHYCCMMTRTCQPEFNIRYGIPCPEARNGVTRCDEEADCFHLANEVLPIDVRGIEVSPPDEEGQISIEGTVLPQSLVTIENRGLSGLGIGRASWKRTTISDLEGRFSLPELTARADDELVVQLRDLSNLRTPPAQVIVPDPIFSTLDVVSIEGWEPIVDGRPGVIAVRLALGGADGRGFCPDSGEAPATCYTGGLSHSMITSVDLRLSRGGASLAPRPAPIGENRPHAVGAQGDLHDGPRDYVIAIDMSAGAGAIDPDPPRRFAAARELVRRLRDRDRVGLVAVGGDAREISIGPPEAVLAELAVLQNEPLSGERDLFAAASRAAVHLKQAEGARPGNVVAVMTGDVPGSANQALEAAAAARESLGFRRVDVVTIGVGGGNLEAMRRLARNGDPAGDVIDLDSIALLDRAVYDLAHQLVGSFILLYEVDLPEGIGKQDCVEMDLTASIGGVSISTSFRGVVTFEGAAGDPSTCD
jgi:hypothetical protein